MKACPDCEEGSNDYRPMLVCGWCGEVFEAETKALLARLHELETDHTDSEKGLIDALNQCADWNERLTARIEEAEGLLRRYMTPPFSFSREGALAADVQDFLASPSAPKSKQEGET
jgi:hypothetical protein